MRYSEENPRRHERKVRREEGSQRREEHFRLKRDQVRRLKSRRKSINSWRKRKRETGLFEPCSMSQIEAIGKPSGYSVENDFAPVLDLDQAYRLERNRIKADVDRLFERTHFLKVADIYHEYVREHGHDAWSATVKERLSERGYQCRKRTV